MQKISRNSLYTLEDYAAIRPDFRTRVMAHKKDRQVPIGAHATLYFEDELTMRYQVQEMLRTERIFEPREIDHELAVYNPLIPDGSNWKATLMIEYEDATERARMLARLTGIENLVWVQVDGFEPVWAIADEDLERSDGEKTSAVHFLRFELTPGMVMAVKAGAKISAGIDHPGYSGLLHSLPEPTRESLAADLH